MSEPIQSIAQNNYILQAPPPTATMFTTELEYDGDKISGYAGSAFKAGTDLEFGYDSADNISAINNSALTDVSLNNIVQTNSGAWGGSALPVSAGPGIKVNLVDNTLVFSNDETVLFSGEYSTARKSISFSEPVSNFNSIKILWQHMDPNYTVRWAEYNPDCRLFDHIQGRNTGGSAAANFYTFYTYWTNNTTGMTFYYDILQTNLTGGIATKTGGYNEVNPVKVIGIGRKQ